MKTGSNTPLVTESQRSLALRRFALGVLLFFSPLGVLRVWPLLPVSDPQARAVKLYVGLAIVVLEVLSFVLLWQSRRALSRWMALLALMLCILSGLVALFFLEVSIP